MAPSDLEYQQKIRKLCDRKNAVILAHYYQDPRIQDIADYVGDSLGLSIQAAQTKADIIVFAGVKFMAETAKILNPEKKVIIPDLKAGCSLEESCPASAFKAFCQAHPDHIVVTYVNTSAEVKAMSDITCTSSNAVDIINAIDVNTPIIFAPDKNLGAYIQKQTKRDNMILWEGACIVHESFSMDKVLDIKEKNMDAEIIAHPESEANILKIAKYVGSTSGLIEYVKNSNCQTFIVATEAGILHEMQKAATGKTLIPAPIEEDNDCKCSECPYMKLNTLEKLYLCLENEGPEITIDKTTAQRALLPIKRMLDFSSTKTWPAQIS